MKYYTLQSVYNFVNDNHDVIDSIKITSFTVLDFNSMSGYDYQINFKVETNKEYKNKLIRVLTNSTYLEDFFPENDDGDMTDKEYYQITKNNILETMIL